MYILVPDKEEGSEMGVFSNQRCHTKTIYTNSERRALVKAGFAQSPPRTVRISAINYEVQCVLFMV